MKEISYAHVPYLRTSRSGSKNVVMKRIQIMVKNDWRIAEVEEEINNLKLTNGKDFAKYATSATDNKLTISEGKLTVYIVLKSSPGKKHRNFCTRGNWNHKSTDVAHMKFIEKYEKDGTDGKDEKDEKDENNEKDEDEKDEKDGKDEKNKKV